VTHPSARIRFICLQLLLVGAFALGVQVCGLSVHAQAPVVPSGSTLFAGATESTAFPAVSMTLFAVDPTGLPILSLQPEAFVVTENGAAIASERLTLREETDVALDLVVALDRSTDDASWDQMRTAVFRMLEQLRPGDEVALLSYAETVDVLSAPTQDLNQVRAALTGAAPGGTLNALNQAVSQGLELLGPDEGRRRALVVIANGANDIAPEGEPVVPATDTLIQSARAQGTAIQTMGYGPAALSPDLVQMATGTGGRPIAATSAAD
jgi:hypothetical protein